MRRITLLGIITPMLMLVGMSNAQVAGVQANVSSDTPSLMQQVDVVHAPDGRLVRKWNTLTAADLEQFLAELQRASSARAS